MDMKFSFWISAVLAGAMVVVLITPIQAHHSLPAYYNVEGNISITGVLKQVKIANPHSSFLVEVSEPNGQKATWIAVASNATQMQRAGWTDDTIKLGTTVTVEGNPARNESSKGILVKFIVTPDGRRLSPGRID
jgi:hypothetical protein